MGKPTRRKKRKASSGCNSDTSPKQETKRNNLGEVSFPTKLIMAAQTEQDQTSPSSSEIWKLGTHENRGQSGCFAANLFSRF